MKLIDRLLINYKALIIREKLKAKEDYLDLYNLIRKNPKIEIKEINLDPKISGCINFRKDKSLIVINRNDSFNRKRFTIAHELYHYFYDGNDDHANIFASYLLAPYNALYKKIKQFNYEISDENLNHLSKHFGMSKAALFKRLVLDGYLSDEKLKHFIKHNRKERLEIRI